MRVTGYLIRQKKQGPESTNCGSSTYVDYHWWLTAARGLLQAQSVVAEPSPRTIANHPNWKSAILRSDKRYPEGQEPRVRIAGWLLFDQEHPEQLNEHRGTLWEIHPVTNIDVWNGSTWVDLDEGHSETPAPWKSVYTIEIECSESPPDARELLATIAKEIAKKAAHIETLGTLHCTNVQLERSALAYLAVVLQTPLGPRGILIPVVVKQLTTESILGPFIPDPCGTGKLADSTYRTITTGSKLWQGSERDIPSVLPCIDTLLRGSRS